MATEEVSGDVAARRRTGGAEYIVTSLTREESPGSMSPKCAAVANAGAGHKEP